MPDTSLPTAVTVDAVLACADARLEASRAALFELLRIPSVSAQPAHREGCGTARRSSPSWSTARTARASSRAARWTTKASS